MTVGPIHRDRAHLFAAIAEQAEAEGKAARAAVRAALAREYRIRRSGACVACVDDTPSSQYCGRLWCRACGRTW